MEELIELAEAGYIVEMLVEDSDDHDFAVSITKKGTPEVTTTTTFIDRATFNAADTNEKVKLIDDTFLEAKSQLDSVLLDDNNDIMDRVD